MRYFGADILLSIKSYLETNLNTNIGLIDVESAPFESLDQVISFRYGTTKKQYPECLILAKDSEVLSEELTMDIQDTPEVYPLDVMILLKDNTDDVFLKQEYYIKALQVTLHGFSDENISWILVKNCIRADAFTEQNEILKVVGVSLEIRIL